jgi:hypothetical protein
MRVFHDINAQEKRVEVLGFVKKPQTFQWLQDYGAPQ